MCLVHLVPLLLAAPLKLVWFTVPVQDDRVSDKCI